MVTIRSPCCGYNLVRCVELKWKDLSSYSHKIESVSLRKYLYDHKLTNKAYLSVIISSNQQSSIFQSFTYKMAARTSWHRYGTKLRYCHPMYNTINHRPLIASITPCYTATKWRSCRDHRLCDVTTPCVQPTATRQKVIATHERLEPRNDLDRVGDVVAGDGHQVAVLFLGRHRTLAVTSHPRVHLHAQNQHASPHTNNHSHSITARRYASAVHAVVVCPSVCLSVRPSVTSRHCIETTGRIELVFLARRPLSVYPTLRCKEIWVSPKLGYFPLELCPKIRN